jgi:hypothetical protein
MELRVFVVSPRLGIAVQQLGTDALPQYLA